MDTRWRAEAETALARLDSDSLGSEATLAYVKGSLEALHDRIHEAIRWLVCAQSVLRSDEARLGARIAFELAYLYLTRNERTAADAVLAWGEGLPNAGESSDLLHLRALLAEHIGDHAHARPLYRAAVRASLRAHTPLSKVLALTNLAVSMTHVDARDSLALGGLALAMLEAEMLDPRIRPAIRNVMGYALICLGRLDEARGLLELAYGEAQEFGHRRIRLYARFNISIIHELDGDIESAAILLSGLADEADIARLHDLRGWIGIRLAWIALRRDDVGSAAHLGIESDLRGESYADALNTLRALALMRRGSHGTARRMLTDLERRAADLGDPLTQFVLRLWIARAEALAGRSSAARRWAQGACAIKATGGFKLSPNWWSPEIVRNARMLEPDGGCIDDPLAEQAWVDPALPRVTITPERISVGATSIGPERWRTGRTGRRVLRRFFDVLLAAYPSGLDRDSLCDLLWPSSDGDRALANLQAATTDLRHLLADVPGVELHVRDGHHVLVMGPNVYRH